MNQVMTIPDMVRGVEPECQQLITAHNAVNWPAEANYAMQLLSANTYALGVAQKNPVSVQNALRNAAAIGVSLNPASKNAYLVPRGGAICLDISYMGLLHLAMSTGSIEFGQSKLVYANDTYENQGIDQAPLHRSNTFGDRGELVGAYCVVRTSTGAYLTEEMSIAQLLAVKARSESGKQNKGPWFTDFEEMCRKTVVKRAAKMWPKVDRLHNAIEYLNTEGGEGISKEEPARDVTPISLESEAWLTDYMNALNDEQKPRMMAWLKVESICQLTEQQAQSAIKTLGQKEMSIFDRAMAQLKAMENVFGFDPTTIEQGSLEWKIMRLGVLTASKADKIVAGKDTDGRATYMAELISDIVNCNSGDESNFKQTDWGKLYEPEARTALSAALGFADIKEIPLTYKDQSMRIAVSPDGVFGNVCCEIKAPFDGTNHIKHAAFDKVKPEWQWQRQFQIFGTGCEKHIFCTYDPRVILGANNLHYTETYPDDKKQATLRDAVPQFIADLDAALEKLGVTFGQHWEYLKQQRSKI